MMSEKRIDHEALSRWAESDAMPEAIKNAKRVSKGTDQSRAATRAMLEAAAGGRPNLGAEDSGAGSSPRRQVRLPKTMSDRLDAYAQAHGQPASEVMREAIRTYLDEVA